MTEQSVRKALYGDSSAHPARSQLRLPVSDAISPVHTSDTLFERTTARTAAWHRLRRRRVGGQVSSQKVIVCDAPHRLHCMKMRGLWPRPEPVKLDSMWSQTASLPNRRLDVLRSPPNTAWGMVTGGGSFRQGPGTTLQHRGIRRSRSMQGAGRRSC